MSATQVSSLSVLGLRHRKPSRSTGIAERPSLTTSDNDDLNKENRPFVGKAPSADRRDSRGWWHSFNLSARRGKDRAETASPFNQNSVPLATPSSDNDDGQERESGDEYSSSSSESSLLSDRESWDSSAYEYKFKGRQRVRRRFKVRNRILQHLRKVKSKTFFKMLRRNEMAARALERAKRKEHNTPSVVEFIVPNPDSSISIKDDDTVSTAKNESTGKCATSNTAGGDGHSKSRSLSRKKLLASPLGGILIFEFYQGLPAILLVPVYSIANIAFFQVIDYVFTMIYLVFKSYFGMDMFTFDMITVFIGYLMMRATGYIWIFVDDDSHLGAKFELHNRAKLGYWDARVIAFFNEHPVLANMTNMASFYMIYAVVNNYFDTWGKDYIFDTLEAWYENVLVDAKEAAMEQDAMIDSLSQCELVWNFVQPSTRRVMGFFMCYSDHNDDNVLFPFHFVIWVLFASWQTWLGYDFLESVD